MDTRIYRQGRRKSSGPKRSTTPLDNFLTPGVLFRFPSDSLSMKMPAIFISAHSSNQNETKKFKKTIENKEIQFLSRLEENIPRHAAFEGSGSDRVLGSPSRSMSPLSTSSTEKSIETSPVLIPNMSLGKRKHCKSCGTRKTPYWRDGWGSGINLCNACGIRFHKYRKLCESCQCVAKKDEKGLLQCPRCFEIL